MLFRTTLAALAVSMTLAAPAAAETYAECLWRSLPAAERQALVDRYPTEGLGALGSDAPETAYLGDCQVPAAALRETASLFRAVYMENATRAVLARKHGIPVERLDAAWAAAAPQDLQALRAGARLLFMDDPKAPDLYELTMRVGEPLDPPRSAAEDLAAYILARAARESGQSRR